MRALIVYESMFGNTRAIAMAIAEGVQGATEVDVREVADAPATLPLDLELLVVGGPTHVHGLTSATTRADAARRAGARLVSRGTGVREWLDTLPAPRSKVSAAAFDTRIGAPKLLTGSAAKGIAKRLEEVGCRVLEPASFIVDGPSGEPFDRVSAEEIDRARAWGRQLGQAVERRLAVSPG